MEQKKAKSRGIVDFLKTKGRLWLLLGGALLGILLLLLGSGIGESPKSAPDTAEGEPTAAELLAYQTELEAELEGLCESVAGVGNAEVMVRLSCGYRTRYATDENGSPVKVGSGSSTRALPEAIEPPTVAGVGVVCRGGNDPHVHKALTDLISTALDIPTNRVCVVGK